ncbi:hypothetical protein ACS5PN_24390 [Roseateles sp. NT4]|uniref:hypothetical protein n=1 Tax=Roseateles sp. NT4 TaxID=3453715 RepID=UPI003EEDB3FD
MQEKPVISDEPREPRVSHIACTTDDFDPGRFRPHGRVEYEQQGRVLWCTATGPFNAELVEALKNLATSTFPAMAANGPWASICTFRHSALCSPEVLAEFTGLIRQLAAMNLAPTANAFILKPDIDGATLMRPLYEKCFRDGGVRYEAFTTAEQAAQWAASVIGPLGCGDQPDGLDAAGQ